MDYYNSDTQEVTFVLSISPKSENLHCLLPRSSNKVMTYFPFRELGKILDCTTSDLVIFGHQLFSFTDKSAYVEKVDLVGRLKKMEELSYCLVVITSEVYKKLKTNLGRYDAWMNTEHMNLVSSWFL